MTAIWPFSTLLDRKAPFIAVVLSGWIAATLPAALLVAAAQEVLPPDMFEAVEEALFADDNPVWVDALSIVAVAPLVETLVMALLFWLTRIIGLGVRGQVAAQVLFWAAAHGAFALAWAIGPAWIFFVLSIMWVGQRGRSWSRAYWSVVLVHGLNNALAFSGIAMERLGWMPAAP